MSVPISRLHSIREPESLFGVALSGSRSAVVRVVAANESGLVIEAPRPFWNAEELRVVFETYPGEPLELRVNVVDRLPSVLGARGVRVVLALHPDTPASEADRFAAMTSRATGNRTHGLRQAA